MAANSDHQEDLLTAKYDLGSPELGPLQGPAGSADVAGLSTISLAEPATDSHAGTQLDSQQQEQPQQQQIDSIADTPRGPPAAAAAEKQTTVAPAGTEVSAADHPPDAALGGPLQHKNLPIKVWVKDPEKVEVSRIGVTFASYVTYLVRTECSSHVFPDAGELSAASKAGVHVFEVRRRFADFEMLHRLMRSHYRGYFLPPLPDKAFLESRFAGEGFLKLRKVDLQAYMCSVANHPALQGSDVLQLFLSQSGDLSSCSRWQQLIQHPAPADILLGLLKQSRQQRNSSAPADNASGASGAGSSSSSSNPLGMVMRMKHSLMNVVQPKAKPEVPADEQQLQQAKEWFKELQQHLSICVAVVRSFVGHLESLAADLNDLGRSMSHMARYEEQLAQRQGQYTASGTSSTQRAADLQLVGYAALRQQAVEKQVVSCLEEREEALEAVMLLEEELGEKQAAATRAAAALGPVAAADKRLAALNASIHALTEKWAGAREQYELYKERNQSELVRLNLQRAMDFRESLQRFAAVQLQLAQAAAEVWKNAVEQFGA